MHVLHVGRSCWNQPAHAERPRACLVLLCIVAAVSPVHACAVTHAATHDTTPGVTPPVTCRVIPVEALAACKLQSMLHLIPSVLQQAILVLMQPLVSNMHCIDMVCVSVVY